MLGERIKLLRKANKLNQVELGNKLEVTKQTVSNWENENILPSVDMLIKICEFFNVSTDYILGLDDKTYIEVTGLSVETLAHIQQIINDIRGKKV
ncbi:MAG: helix-turn-helix transcriptional regulator [Clostridia bacterium]|nr:helix-turn-helix transcriptional regulator [Clostridia bacterium]